MQCPRCGKEVREDKTMFNYSLHEWVCDKCHSTIEIEKRMK